MDKVAEAILNKYRIRITAELQLDDEWEGDLLNEIMSGKYSHDEVVQQLELYARDCHQEFMTEAHITVEVEEKC